MNAPLRPLRAVDADAGRPAVVNAVCVGCEQGRACRFKVRCDPDAARLARLRARDLAEFDEDAPWTEEP